MKIQMLLSIFFAFLIATSCSTQQRHLSSSTTLRQVASPEEGKKGSMDYVGFYAAALTRVGAKTDYIEETAKVSNFIMVVTEDIKQNLEKIEKAKSYHLPVILGVTHVFYQPGSAKLYPNYKQRFFDFMQELKSVESQIIGFYPLDEPNGNNRVMGDQRISDEELFKNQVLINDFIHQTYPDKITMTIFSANETNDQLLLPQNTDYIGFDCYMSFGSGCNPELLIKRYQVLMAKKTPRQKLIAVVDSYFDHMPTLQEQKKLVNHIQWWADFIKDKNEFAAVIPFFYFF